MIIIIKKWKEDDEYFEVQYDTETKKYYSCFRDVKRKNQRVEIREDIVQAYIEASKVARKFKNEFSRHIEHSELTEHTLNNRMLFKQESIEDLIIRKTSLEDLRKAINMLPEVQRRRIKLYYFDELTEKEIAKLENVSQKNISKSSSPASSSMTISGR